MASTRNLLGILEMNTTVKFFASLRETIGVRQLDLQITDSTAVTEIWDRATDSAAMPDNVLIAVNHEYVNRTSVANPGDEVAFFPPVTGG